ncbi:MAG: hypothetical protein NWE80_04820 [Candidatus Bathyarchaeota archaeon]|nr:hypothetical protein [Candidatus Bathyarchaeota archaeon]
MEHLIKEPQPTEVMMKWNEVVHSDEELRQRQESYHKLQLQISQALAEQQRKKLEIVKMLHKPNPNWKEIEKLEAAAERPKILTKKSLNDPRVAQKDSS